MTLNFWHRNWTISQQDLSKGNLIYKNIFTGLSWSKDFRLKCTAPKRRYDHWKDAHHFIKSKIVPGD